MVAPPGDPQRGLRDLHVARPAARHDRHDAAHGPGLRHHARGARRLANVAEKALGVTAPKDLQTSDWSAARLSEQQLRYAALDAVIAPAPRASCIGAWSPTPGRHSPRRTKRSDHLGMRLEASPFNVPTHLATIAAWESSRPRPARRSSRRPARTCRSEALAVRLAAAPLQASMPTMCSVVAAHQDRHPQHQRRPPEAAGLVRVGAPADRGRQGRPAAQQLRPQADRGDQPRDRPPAR